MEQLTPILEKLAKQLGTTVEMVWSVMIAQARIYAVTSVIQWIIAIGLLIGVLKYLKKSFDRSIKVSTDKWGSPIRTSNNKDFKMMNQWEFWQESDQEPRMFVAICCCIVGGVIGVIACLVLSSDLGNFIASVFNPQYWALNRILSYVGR